MKALSISKSVKLALMSLFTATLLSACGGGGDSSTGAGYAAGSSTISGNVSDGVAQGSSTFERENLLAAVYEVIISEAKASGAAGVGVELYLDGTKVADATTDGSGNFTFANLAPGNYNIQVVENGVVLGKSPVIRLDANTKTRIGMKMNGALTGVKVEASNTTISGEVENKSNDDTPGTPDDSNKGSSDSDSSKGSSNDSKGSKGDDSNNDDNDKGSSNDSNDDNSNDSNDADHNDNNDDDCKTPNCDDDKN